MRASHAGDDRSVIKAPAGPFPQVTLQAASHARRACESVSRGQPALPPLLPSKRSLRTTRSRTGALNVSFTSHTPSISSASRAR
ncbi:hypothetical protein BUB20358_06591 [Burkholderia ubonensis]|nr:hypothetical protein BUB20358_06591 [Burkholderia ubonensis]